MNPTSTDGLLTLRDLLRLAVTRMGRAQVFFGHGQADAVDEAAHLLGAALRLPHERLDVFLDARLTPAEIEALSRLIARRVDERMPVAYLLGEAWLQGYRFRSDPRAIIPRSFIAELLKDGLLPWLDDADSVGSVLDLCTGSGCLAIIAADAFPQAQVDAVDLSADALALAKGYRGSPRGDVGALAEAVAAFSRLARLPGQPVAEEEINPLLVREAGHGVVAVDGLLVRR